MVKELKVVFDTIEEDEDRLIKERVTKNTQLKTLFKWYKAKHPLMGESILLAHLVPYGNYSLKHIRRVVRNDFEEKIEEPEAYCQWVYAKTKILSLEP